MTKRRQPGVTAKAVGKGVLFSMGASLAFIAVFALALKLLNPPDSVIAVINQIIKVISVLIGAYMSVGVGGENGAAKGALTGLCYTVAGLGAAMAVSGAISPVLVILSDVALGGSVGALGGAILANMKVKSKAVAARK